MNQLKIKMIHKIETRKEIKLLIKILDLYADGYKQGYLDCKNHKNSRYYIKRIGKQNENND